MPKLDHQTKLLQPRDLDPSLVPPAAIIRTGLPMVEAYAQFHANHIAHSQSDAFIVAVPNFLDWWDDVAAGAGIDSITEDNVDQHLDALAAAQCSEDERLARLCAIDLFLRAAANVEPALARIARGHYARPRPPALLVETSAQMDGASDETFLTVFADFLASHTSPLTRDAYHSGLLRFFDWVTSDAKGARLQDIREMRGSHVAAFIASVAEADETSGMIDTKPRTVGTIMSAVRTYLDACIAAGLLTTNVARAVRLPKVPTGRGATPVVAPEVVGRMLDMIPLESDADYRDRAMIAMMGYSLFRVSAVCRMRVRNYQMRGNQRYLTTIEKKTKVHEMPVHEVLAHYLDDYLMQTGLIDHPDAPLFQGSVTRTGALNGVPFSRNASWKMIQRRAKAAGHFGEIGNHSLRATGITTYLGNGGQLEEARKMAGHASAETTRLYDRNTHAVDPDEVSKIRY